jgi:hypothetical protein
MSLRKITKVMKSFIWQYKIAGLIILFLIIIITIPLLVIAIGDVNTGFFVENGKTVIVSRCTTDTRDGSGNCPSASKTCIRNNSSLTYFVPTKTLAEWSAFLSHLPSSVNPVVCNGDGYCDTANGETCSTSPSDCGACAPTCTSFTYSDWYGCDSNGNTTRYINSASPSGCVGGNPYVAKTCCSGCRDGYRCTNQTYYSNSSCSGYSSNVINSGCVSSTDFPYYGYCYNMGSSYFSIYVTSASGCYYLCDPAPSSPPGCPAGSTCRAVTFYPNNTCAGSYSSEGAPYCVSDSVAVSSCIPFSYGTASLSYITGARNSGTGCTQASIIPN